MSWNIAEGQRPFMAPLFLCVGSRIRQNLQNARAGSIQGKDFHERKGEGLGSRWPRELPAVRAISAPRQLADQCQDEQIPQERSETAEGFRGRLCRSEHSTRRESSAILGRRS